MKLSIQLKLSAAWAAAGATLSLAIFPFGLRSGLIREAIQKKCPTPLLLFFLFLKFHLKSMDLSLFLEGGWVSRKDHLVTLLRCHYWLGGVGVQGKSDNVTLYHVFSF